MNDRALLDPFLNGKIDGRAFRHADHVRAAYEILQVYDFSTAAYLFSAALKRMAARAGNPGAYHETITLAFLALIAERSAGRAFDHFDDFADDNPDLLDKAVLGRRYRPERLRSDIARRIFLLPDLAP